MKIGIIAGSVREGRVADKVATWVADLAAEKNPEATFEVVDLKEFDVPLLTSATVPGAAQGKYDDPKVQAWGDKIAEFDGYIFVTPEYNHSVPGAFKNAFDSLGVEWTGKPVAFVSYGADNGVRAVEHWRTIVANFQMFGVRQQVSFNRFMEFPEGGFAPLERRPAERGVLLDPRLTAVWRSQQA